MAEKEFMMRLHGDFLHRQSIYVLKDILAYKEGVEIKDERQFKKRACPCEPDIFVGYMATHRKGNTKFKVKELHVFEVETNPTKASMTKKQQQYEESLAGVRLTVVDLNRVLDKMPYDETFEGQIELFRKYLELELPI